MKTHKVTIPSHTFEATSNKNIFRFVDREGNWTHYWIKNKKIFVPAVNHIIRSGYPKGERFYQYLLHANPIEAERRLSTAGEEGARTHRAIHDLIVGKRVTLDTLYHNELTDRKEPLNLEEWHNLETFVAWAENYNPRVLLYETAIWSETFGFAGTVDFVGTIHVPEGDKNFPVEAWNTRILILLDWKTSSAIWDEYELQTAAYRKALLEYMPQQIPLYKYPEMWTGIVRLGTSHRRGFEVKVWTGEESEANFALFASAYAIFVRKEGLEFEYELKNIPSEFKLAIPRMRNVVKKNKKRT
jgi:hypothetical protein